MYKYPDYLMHYGIKGMKWGVRKQRVTSGKTKRRSSKGSMSEEDKKARRRRNAKIAAGVAGGVAAAALAAYGAYKFKDFVNDTNFKYHDELGRKKVKEFTERYERLADNTYSRAQKQARDRLKSGRNTPDQYRYNITSATRMNAQRHFAAGNSHYLRPDSPALLDAAERHASKVNKKKQEIWLREFKKQSTDSFPQAVKNTATYYKNRKRKRR